MNPFPFNATFKQRVLWFVIQVLAAIQARCWSWMGEKVWRTHDGRVLFIRDMDDQHLENVIRYARRCSTKRDRDLLSELLTECARRSEKETKNGHRQAN